MPEGLHVGGERLAAASCGVRGTLWIEHYAAALYLPRRANAAPQLADANVTKAVRVQILSKRLMPKDIPRKWRQPMATHDPGLLERVRDVYRQLKVGDEVLIAYTPNHGVELALNGTAVATAQGHGLIDALLRAWAEDEPLPKKLEDVMARNRCPLPTTAAR